MGDVRGRVDIVENKEKKILVVDSDTVSRALLLHRRYGAGRICLDGADEICELLNVDTSCSAVAVLLVGHADTDAVSSASIRDDAEAKVSYIQ